MPRSVRLLLFATLLAGSACAPLQHLGHEVRLVAKSAGILARHDIDRQHQRVLPPDTRLYVSRGLDLPDAAREPLIRSVGEGLHRHFTDVVRATVNETREQAVASAWAHGADYVVYPAVFVWRDEEGARTALRRGARRPPDLVVPDLLSPADRAVIRLSLIDVRGNVVIDSSTVEVSAPWSTVRTDLPQLVATSMERYASTFWMPSVDDRRFPGP